MKFLNSVYILLYWAKKIIIYRIEKLNYED